MRTVNTLVFVSLLQTRAAILDISVASQEGKETLYLLSTYFLRQLSAEKCHTVEPNRRVSVKRGVR